MKKLLSAGMLALALFGFILGYSGIAGATTYQELSDIYDTELAVDGFAHIDGNDVSLSPMTDTVLIYINGQPIGSAALDDKDAILKLIADYLGIPLTSAGSLTEPTSAAATTSRLVFTELVVPTAKTSTEKRRLAAQKAQGGVRTFGAALRTEWVEHAGDENGQITGFNLGMAYDVDNYTFGVMVPYDYFDFDSFSANRIGAIGFGQYHLGLTEELEATFTANLNYMFANYDFGSFDEDLNTYGAGLSAGLSFSQEDYAAGCGLSYQYNQDDVDSPDDEQHLLKLGGNVGIYMTPDQVLNLLVTWNYDATDYKNDYGDTDYFELGVEYRANFSETWAMSAGYRKVVDLENFDSDMVYLGTVWQF